MNILLSSVGRKSYIVDYFKEALKHENGKVIGANSENGSLSYPIIYKTKIWNGFYCCL